jgi:sortase A
MLKITPEQDYVTLLTCTPYGVNSHRLLVRGHRTEYVRETSADNGGRSNGTDINLWVVIPLGLIALLLLVLTAVKVIKQKK